MLLPESVGWGGWGEDWWCYALQFREGTSLAGGVQKCRAVVEWLAALPPSCLAIKMQCTACLPPPPLQGGLAPRVVELLKRPNASAALPLTLLQMVRCMYEHHPRPKVRVCELVLAQHCLYSLLLPSCGSKVWRLGLH